MYSPFTIQVADSKGHTLFRKDEATKGKFAFTTEDYDMFEVCFLSVTTGMLIHLKSSALDNCSIIIAFFCCVHYSELPSLGTAIPFTSHNLITIKIISESLKIFLQISISRGLYVEQRGWNPMRREHHYASIKHHEYYYWCTILLLPTGSKRLACGNTGR